MNSRFKLVLKKILLSSVVVVLLAFPNDLNVFAATFSDSTQAEFDIGTYSNTAYNVGFNEIELTPAGRTSGTGTYTSNIKDAGLISEFQNFSWIPVEPYGKELPGNLGSESYEFSSANMTGNYGLWRLNETIATPVNFADSSGSGNNLTCGTVCPSTFPASLFNSARQSTATNQAYLIPTAASARNRAIITLSMWFRPTSVTGTRILWNESIAANANERINLEMNGSQVRIRTRNNDAGGLTTRVTSTNNVVNNAWNHVVATYNANTDTHRIYLNGTLTSNNSNVNPFPNTTSSLPGSFGRRRVEFTTTFLGAMDEVAFFDRELTTDEMVGLYQRGILDIGFQIRSCDDSSCIGENFVGPDGTSLTFYRDSGAASYPPTFTSLPVIDNQYFQYRSTLTTTNPSFYPVYKTVSVDYNSNVSYIGFAIRNITDTADQNSCDLSNVSTTTVSNCSYRLKPETNALSGYTVYVQTASPLSSGSDNITDALVGTGGAGGTNITAGTAGTESYGIKLTPGTSTSGTVSINSIFNAGSTNSVRFNYGSATALYSTSGANIPAGTDTINTALMNHNLNISASTPAGNYTQQIVYTVVPNF